MIPGRQIQLASFEADARKAITENPDYFVWWYTVKSVGLGVVGAFAAFMVGHHIGAKKSPVKTRAATRVKRRSPRRATARR